MSFIVSPNMSLPVPVVGQEPGPDYAKDVNNSLSLIDAHDHSPGKGVQITPAGLNINALLSFQGNFATNLAGLTLSAQSVTPAINTIYQSGVNLFFRDGNGNAIQITANGGIAGTSGSISNLTPPASAAYISGLSTFVWQSNVNIAANMDFGSATLRNLSPNSTFGLTLSPPAGLSSNYTITLPTLPSVPSFMTIDNAGNISDTIPVSAGITGSNIAANTITAANIAANTIISSNIANGAIGLTQLASTVLQWNTTTITSSGTFTVPVNVNKLFVIGVGGGGGGGAAATSVATAGGGGGGSTPMYSWISVSPGDVLTISIGAAGLGGSPPSGSGSNGGDTTVTYATGELLFKGGTGGQGATGGQAAGGNTYPFPVYAPGALFQSGGASAPNASNPGLNAIPTMPVAVGAIGGTSNGAAEGGGAGGSGLGPGVNGGNAVNGVIPTPPAATNFGSGGGGAGSATPFVGGGVGGNGAPGAVVITWLGHA